MPDIRIVHGSFSTIAAMHAAMLAARATLAAMAIATSGRTQEPESPARFRATLEAATARVTVDVAGAFDKRGNDVFDVLVTAIDTDGAAIGGAQRLASLLPGPEKAGLTTLLTELAAAEPKTRAAFADAVRALANLEAALADRRSPRKLLAERHAALTACLDAEPHAWIRARASLVAALMAVDGDLASQAAPLSAAAAVFDEAHDRFHLALTSVLWSKALVDAGECRRAIRMRDDAQALIAALKCQMERPGLVSAVLARTDASVARRLFDDGWDEPALVAAQRTRAVARLQDPDQESDAAILFAWIMIERRSYAAALEVLKPQQPRLSDDAPPDIRLRLATVLGTAMRLSGRVESATDVLRKTLARTATSKADARAEVLARFTLGLCLAQSKQAEAASEAFDAVAAKAASAGIAPLGRAAMMNRAILQLLTNNPDQAAKGMAAAVATSAGGATLDRIQGCGPLLVYADLLVDAGKPGDAMPWLRMAAGVSEEIGLSLDELRMPAGAVIPPSRVPLPARLAATITASDLKPDWSTLEPAFLAAETPAFDVVSRLGAADAAASETRDRADESRRKFTRILRALAGLRPPIAEAEAAAIVRERAAVVDEVWTQDPAFATRAFPRFPSLERARSQYCGYDGAIFHAVFSSAGSYVLAFSRNQLAFRFIPPSTPILDMVAKYRTVLRDPSSSPAAFVAAAGPLYDSLITPLTDVLDGRTWMAVYFDPALDDIPIECLVPTGTAATSWANLPYLMNTVAIGRIPTAGRTLAPRNRRPTSWLDEVRLVAVQGGGAPEVLEGARQFDPALTAASPRGDRALVVTREEYCAPTALAESRHPRAFPPGGVLWFGPGFPQASCEWPAGSTPGLVVSSDFLRPQFNGDDLTMRMIGKGARAVIAPRAPMDAELVDGLLRTTFLGLAEQSVGPIQALARAKQALLGGRMKSAAGTGKAEWKHPAVWTALEAWVARP